MNTELSRYQKSMDQSVEEMKSSKFHLKPPIGRSFPRNMIQ